ncbi:purine operon repressor, PurR [Caloramator fervidus]|uniref:Purine operon repressor, PurR n=1 Tax=Caloramator fervidus TaxID=29344 RepID=A0A1H5UWK6_9CLOT|nr:pur operon repressor [Caloramator fervidus]SEF79386.1 purine operon repressor, PurR [Caloramator fervidus]
MERLNRKERVAAILKILSDNPNKVISLSYFQENFNMARSTLSEDVTILKKVVEDIGVGSVETVAGPTGGVKFVAGIKEEEKERFLLELCESLKNPDRIMPGGFLYTNDLIFSPDITNKLGIIFASYFKDKDIDYVLTVETKGIPIAMMTARYLNVPLVIVRRENKVTEGPTVSINYVSGSTKKIQTMCLSKRAVKRGSNVIFIDDFMRGGGTASGIIKLMEEFESKVVGIGVLIEVKTERKLVQDYVSLLSLEKVDEENQIINIYPRIL